MSRARRLIEAAARILDETGKRDCTIRTAVSRRYLMRLGFKPLKRGGELMLGAHPVISKRKDPA